MFVWNKSKTKKLFGGMGSITEYGSTVILTGDEKYFPYIYYDRDWIVPNNSDIVNLINSIAKNPLISFLDGDNKKLYGKMSFYNMMTKNEVLSKMDLKMKYHQCQMKM